MYLHTFCKSHLLPRGKRSVWVDIYSFDNNCIYTPRFPPKFLPHFTICLDMSKILKYADQLLHKQAKLISTSKLTRIRTIILWPVIYNNRFFFKDEWFIWSLTREVDLSTKVWKNRNDACSWNPAGLSLCFQNSQMLMAFKLPGFYWMWIP